MNNGTSEKEMLPLIPHGSNDEATNPRKTNIFIIKIFVNTNPSPRLITKIDVDPRTGEKSSVLNLQSHDLS